MYEVNIFKQNIAYKVTQDLMLRTHSSRRAVIRDGTTVEQLVLTYPLLTEAEEVFKAHVYIQNIIL